MKLSLLSWCYVVNVNIIFCTNLFDNVSCLRLFLFHFHICFVTFYYIKINKCYTWMVQTPVRRNSVFSFPWAYKFALINVWPGDDYLFLNWSFVNGAWTMNEGQQLFVSSELLCIRDVPIWYSAPYQPVISLDWYRIASRHVFSKHFLIISVLSS